MVKTILFYINRVSILTEFLDVEKRLELQKEIFTTCRKYLVDHLNPDDVVDILISEHLIGRTASNQLNLPTKTKQEKNRITVDELFSGGPDTYEKFCGILKKISTVKHIADKLEEGSHIW